MEFDIVRIEQRVLTRDEARDLTDAIKGTATVLWQQLEAARRGKAHIALGYDTWEAYVTKEFDMTRQRAGQLLRQARVVRELGSMETTVSIPELNESQTRLIQPHLDEVKRRVAAGEKLEDVIDDLRQRAQALADARKAQRETEVARAELEQRVNTQAATLRRLNPETIKADIDVELLTDEKRSEEIEKVVTRFLSVAEKILYDDAARKHGKILFAHRAELTNDERTNVINAMTRIIKRAEDFIGEFSEPGTVIIDQSGAFVVPEERKS